MKIYIGCPIQGFSATDWQKHWDKLEKLKGELRKRGHEILDFKSTREKHAPPGTVFIWDHEQCMECDAMIAIALGPSTGMGMEIAMCLMKPSPAFVFGTAPQETEVSRMVTECNLPGFVFERYEKFENIPDMFEKLYKNRISSNL